MSFIYALVCPDSEEIKYIGKADRPKSRFISHLSTARQQTYTHKTCKWIRSLLDEGKCPVLKVLFRVPIGVDWQDAEKCAIAEYRSKGCDLTNSTTGGQGLKLYRPEDKAALSASLANAWKRQEVRSARIERMKETNSSPESRARRVAAAADPVTKAKHAAGISAGLFGNPEVMARRRASQTAASNRPDVKAAKAAASKARWQDPEFRARMHKSRVAAWVKRKERQACNTKPDISRR